MAYRHGPRAKLPTVQELIVHFGAGQATIVSALDELEAQNVLYRKDRQGIFVSPKLNRKLISILLDSQWLRAGSSPFWGQLWGLFAEEAERRTQTKNEDFLFQLVTAWQDPNEPLPDNMRHKIDAGIIHGVISIGLGVVEADWVINSSLPMVAFAGGGFWAVEMDFNRFIDLGVEALVSRGCKQIAKVRALPKADRHAPNPGIDFEEDQWFLGALKANGVPETSGHLAQYPCANNWWDAPAYQEQGEYLAAELFQGGNKLGLDGLLITDDLVASGMLAGLRHCGIVPGKDIAIASHSNAGSPVLYGCEDLLTVIEFDPGDIVRQMFSMLDALMSGGVPNEQDRIVRPALRS